MTGRAYVGTSGFAYTEWAPAFYPPGTRPDALLREYSARLPACELNNTFYQHPRAARIEAWLEATPEWFRFSVKAQRGGSLRAFGSDPRATIDWLTAPYRLFGERLGAVLFRVPDAVPRDDARLAAFLAAWPQDLPLTMELQDPSWLDDGVLGLLRDHGAVLCGTDLETEPQPPALHLTGPFLYVRLRRDDYAAAALDAWALRLDPFLRAGHDCFVFFRHDATGRAALRALELTERIARIAPNVTR